MLPLKCLIVEDEPRALDALTSIISHYPEQLKLVGSASSYEGAIETIRKLKPELIFLDVQLKKRLSFDILKLDFDHTFEVVFVTAYDHYALQAFKNQALSYLLKPVDFDEFEHVVERATKVIRSGEETSNKSGVTDPRISIPREGNTLYLPLSDLLFVKASGSYCELSTISNGHLTVSKPLRFIEDQLPDPRVLRVHRSYLVNPDHVDSWDRGGNTLFMKGEHALPVSREGKKRLKSFFD